ncbi:MAG TPA: hypothetical protein VGE11_02770 [Pseudonocardia sp.]
MSDPSLANYLSISGCSASVAVPQPLEQLLDALQAPDWTIPGGSVAAKVAVGQGLPGFATLALDPGLDVVVELSRPDGTGFRADIVIAVPGGPGPGVTLPGLVGGAPAQSGSGPGLRRWVEPDGSAVRATLHAVLRIEGRAGSAATLQFVPSATEPDGILQIGVEPAYFVLPGGSFGMHLPNGIVLDSSATAAPAGWPGPHRASDDPPWRGLSLRGVELFLPRDVPWVGGVVVPVELDLGAPAGIDARATVDVAAVDGRPRLAGTVEWVDPAALSLAACVPTLVDVSAEFALDGTLVPPTGAGGGAVVTAARPLLVRARYARDTRTTPAEQQFDVTVQGEGPDGLLAVTATDGAGDTGARVFVTAAALAGALLADTTADGGDAGSAGLTAVLGAATALSSSFTKRGKVVVHGVTVAAAVGLGSPTLLLEVDYSVDVLVKGLSFGPLAVTMQDDVPMRVRYRHVQLGIDPSKSGLEKFRLSFGHATTDVEDPGRWAVPGAPFDVLGTRAGHGSTWFEIDLAFTVDLGPVKVSGATVRVTFDGGPEPDVTLRGLAARLTLPGVISGDGRLALIDHGFEAALAVSIVPLKLVAAAYLRLDNGMVLLDLGVDLPGAIPLGPTGLGLYAVGGTFGFNARPRSPGPQDDPVAFALRWTPDQTDRSPGDLMFGLAAVVGTLPDLGFAFSAVGRVLIVTPHLAFRAALDASFLTGRRLLTDPAQPVGAGTITGVLVVDDTGVVVGVRGQYDLSPLLRILVPVDAAFPAGSANWRIHIGSDGAHGRTPGPVQVRILPDLLDIGADAYLMVHGAGIEGVGGRPGFDLDGFAVAFGGRFHAVYGAGLIWLELNADAQFGLGTAPLLARGHGHLDGRLHLGPISIGASADIEAQVGPGDEAWVTFRVCGEVDLFFFEISGCVPITIGNEALDAPAPDTWPEPAMSLCDHAYRETAVAGTNPTPTTLPVVWPDTIPLLSFPVLPGPAGFASAQFGAALRVGDAWVSSYPTVATATGRTGPDDLTYDYTLTGLRLIRSDGTPVPGPLLAAWQQPKATGPSSTAVAAELALLTWQTALWTARLTDGGASRPIDPLPPIVDHCSPGPDAQPGWAVGAFASLLGEDWRMPPEAPPGDPLQSYFQVDVTTAYRQQPVHVSLIGMPPGTGYRPGGPVRFPDSVEGADRAFTGAVGVPGLSAYGPSAQELGSCTTTLTVDDDLRPDRLVLLVEDRFADQVAVAGDWSLDDLRRGTPDATVAVFRSGGSTTRSVQVTSPAQARLAVLGLSGTTATARTAANSAQAAAAAASDQLVTVLDRPVGQRRPMLAPGTTYRVEVTMHCHGQRTRHGTPVGAPHDEDRTTTFWFRTAPVLPPDPPQPHVRTLGYPDPAATTPGHLRSTQVSCDRFDVSYLVRYLVGYTPADRAADVFWGDPVGAHFAADHVDALVRAYQRRIVLACLRTDPPPAAPPTPFAVLPDWSTLWAAAMARMPVTDQRLAALDVASGLPCGVPHAGATYGGQAALVASASYELAAQVAQAGATAGTALPGIVFRTSRYRDPTEQLADLGFAAAGPGSPAGDLPVPTPAGLATLPSTTGDSDADLGVLLDQLGLSLWAPPSVGHGRTSLLWTRPDHGPWRLLGLLLESPESLERPARMRLDPPSCAGVPFNVVRRNATGSRLLCLTRTPLVPPASAVMWLNLLEHPTATTPPTPGAVAQSALALYTPVSSTPAFETELT